LAPADGWSSPALLFILSCTGVYQHIVQQQQQKQQQQQLPMKQLMQQQSTVT